MTTAYPLAWPPGWPRTQWPKRSAFGEYRDSHRGSYKVKDDVTMSRARFFLVEELRRLGAEDVVVSTNLKQRKDGTGPLSSQRKPEDIGVAVYFSLKGKQQCFPCDKWNRIEDNLYAIAKTIEAMRGIARWGSQEMVNATFQGFEQLTNDIRPRSFYFKDCNTEKEIERQFKELAKKMHPHAGGDEQEFIDMTEQYETLCANMKKTED